MTGYAEVCEHGALKRQCEVCHLQAQLAAAVDDNKRLRKMLDVSIGGNRRAAAAEARAEKAEASLAGASSVATDEEKAEAICAITELRCQWDNGPPVGRACVRAAVVGDLCGYHAAAMPRRVNRQ